MGPHRGAADLNSSPTTGSAFMGQVVIENPILNSPFAQPTRHFKFDDDGITDEVEDFRRVSA